MDSIYYVEESITSFLIYKTLSSYHLAGPPFNFNSNEDPKLIIICIKSWSIYYVIGLEIVIGLIILSLISPNYLIESIYEY